MDITASANMTTEYVLPFGRALSLYWLRAQALARLKRSQREPVYESLYRTASAMRERLQQRRATLERAKLEVPRSWLPYCRMFAKYFNSHVAYGFEISGCRLYGFMGLQLMHTGVAMV